MKNEIDKTVGRIDNRNYDDPFKDCQAGCKHFTGGEVRHHPDCVWYPESVSQMLDNALTDLATATQGLERIELYTYGHGCEAPQDFCSACSAHEVAYQTRAAIGKE